MSRNLGVAQVSAGYELSSESRKDRWANEEGELREIEAGLGREGERETGKGKRNALHEPVGFAPPWPAMLHTALIDRAGMKMKLKTNRWRLA